MDTSVGLFQGMFESILSVLSYFVELLPNTDGLSTGGFLNAFNYMMGLMVKLNFILPVDTMETIFMLTMGTELLFVVLWCVNWVVRRIADIIP